MKKQRSSSQTFEEKDTLSPVQLQEIGQQMRTTLKQWRAKARVEIPEQDLEKAYMMGFEQGKQGNTAPIKDREFMRWAERDYPTKMSLLMSIWKEGNDVSFSKFLMDGLPEEETSTEKESLEEIALRGPMEQSVYDALVNQNKLKKGNVDAYYIQSLANSYKLSYRRVVELDRLAKKETGFYFEQEDTKEKEMEEDKKQDYIEIQEDVRLPNTDIILEKGDRIKILTEYNRIGWDVFTQDVASRSGLDIEPIEDNDQLSAILWLVRNFGVLETLKIRPADAFCFLDTNRKGIPDLIIIDTSKGKGYGILLDSFGVGGKNWVTYKSFTLWALN